MGDTSGWSDATKFVIECKVVHRRDSLDSTIARGLQQTAEYMDRSGCRIGNLVVFDPDPDKLWDEKVFRREEFADGRSIVVWGI